MIRLQSLFYLCILTLLVFSCDEKKAEVFPQSSFDAPFPKRNKDLTNVLGKQFTLKTSQNDTLQLRITASKNENIITDAKTGDTLFSGRVSKFRGTYYFNQQFDSTTYWIYAVKITDHLIYGLNTAWSQTFAIDEAIEAGKHPKLVKFIDTSQAVIRLRPDKKEMKILFATILQGIIPDTIINLKSKQPIALPTEAATAKIDPDDYEMFSKVYPNPAKDVLHVELQEKNSAEFILTNLQGQTMLHGKLGNGVDHIDVSKLSNGAYVLTLINPSSKQKEALKIIKSQ